MHAYTSTYVRTQVRTHAHTHVRTPIIERIVAGSRPARGEQALLVAARTLLPVPGTERERPGRR